MKTTKRFISALLAVLLILVFPVTAHAEDPHTDHNTRSCSHENNFTMTQYADPGSTVYLNATYCSGNITTTFICHDCGYTNEYTHVDVIRHKYIGTYSSCNGSVQTLTYSCRYCTHIKVIAKACPNAPHSGPCSALPFGFIHQDTI